ncbi:MAG TPA: DUF2911 domain-containing protein [Balneolaceae bacterium]|nr:DUF2911 domain-containing protein [Balneolaceae bacterium]
MKTKLSLLLSFLVVIMFAISCQQRKGNTNALYVRRLGNDTLSVEQLNRTNNGYHGQYVSRMPATQVGKYQAQLGPDGSVKSLSLNWSTPKENPNGPAPRKLQVTIKDTTATIQMSGAWRHGKTVDTTYSQSVPAGTIPGIISGLMDAHPSVATLTQALHQAKGHYGNSGYKVHIMSPRSGHLFSGTLTKAQGDTVNLKLSGISYPATVNSKGQVTWLSAKNSTVQTITKRQQGNVQQIAANFASMDAHGKGIPIASPRDTVKATINGAHLEVQYSRPSMRGRRIWGGLVPWNKVWRTGANAATQFSTDHDLNMNGTTIPAGTYTLYSIYTPSSAKLIVNSQTGQWGTVYHQKQDFARINMKKTTLKQPVDTFTVSFDSTSSKPKLQLTWNTTRYQLPFTVKK